MAMRIAESERKKETKRREAELRGYGRKIAMEAKKEAARKRWAGIAEYINSNPEITLREVGLLHGFKNLNSFYVSLGIAKKNYGIKAGRRN
jgi:hypothetical protein